MSSVRYPPNFRVEPDPGTRTVVFRQHSTSNSVASTGSMMSTMSPQVFQPFSSLQNVLASRDHTSEMGGSFRSRSEKHFLFQLSMSSYVGIYLWLATHQLLPPSSLRYPTTSSETLTRSDFLGNSQSHLDAEHYELQSVG